MRFGYPYPPDPPFEGQDVQSIVFMTSSLNSMVSNAMISYDELFATQTKYSAQGGILPADEAEVSIKFQRIR